MGVEDECGQDEHGVPRRAVWIIGRSYGDISLEGKGADESLLYGIRAMVTFL